MKSLPRGKLVEVQSKGGFCINGLKRVGAFEVNRHVGVNVAAGADGSPHIDALRPRLSPNLLVISQYSHSCGWNLDVQPRDGAGEEFVCRFIRPACA
jgi:hypothetical protein